MNMGMLSYPVDDELSWETIFSSSVKDIGVKFFCIFKGLVFKILTHTEIIG